MGHPDLENLKKVVAERCSEVPVELFDLSSISGKSARDRIGELNGYFGRFTELFDGASLRYQLQKNMVSDIEAMAIRELLESDEMKNRHKKITSTIIEAYKFSHKTKIGLVLSEENEKLVYFEYAMNRYKGMLKTIQATINSCQSILAFDRVELNTLHHTT